MIACACFSAARSALTTACPSALLAKKPAPAPSAFPLVGMNAFVFSGGSCEGGNEEEMGEWESEVEEEAPAEWGGTRVVVEEGVEGGLEERRGEVEANRSAMGVLA